MWSEKKREDRHHLIVYACPVQNFNQWKNVVLAQTCYDNAKKKEMEKRNKEEIKEL